MSLFGKLDADNIPSNPFFIEKGEYEAEITDAKFNVREGKRQLLITFSITDENSSYFEYKATKYFDLVDPNLTAEDLALLPAADQREIRRQLSSVKNALCGNGRNKGLGVDPDDLNSEDWDPKVLVGTKVEMAVSNYGPKDQGVNVRWANIPSED